MILYFYRRYNRNARRIFPTLYCFDKQMRALLIFCEINCIITTLDIISRAQSGGPMILSNDKVQVKLFDDDGYVLGSNYNARLYDLIIKPKEEPENYSVFGVEITCDGKTITVAVIGDDVACVGRRSAILSDDNLIILQNSRITVISASDGKLVKAVNIGDDGIYFELYRLNDGYIVRVERKIQMLDDDFNEIWSVEGEDAFVCPERENDFVISETGITVYDYMDRKFHIDFNGKIKRIH